MESHKIHVPNHQPVLFFTNQPYINQIPRIPTKSPLIAIIITYDNHMGMGQNLVPLVNPKIAGKWMFIPLKMVLIGIDPYPHASAIVFLAHIPHDCQWNISHYNNI